MQRSIVLKTMVCSGQTNYVTTKHQRDPPPCHSHSRWRISSPPMRTRHTPGERNLTKRLPDSTNKTPPRNKPKLVDTSYKTLEYYLTCKRHPSLGRTSVAKSGLDAFPLTSSLLRHRHMKVAGAIKASSTRTAVSNPAPSCALISTKRMNKGGRLWEMGTGNDETTVRSKLKSFGIFSCASLPP